MGIATWLLAGAGALAAARLIRTGRPPSWWIEGVVAAAAALLAGLGATALDFGGWQEPDWRAGSFAFLTAFAAIGIWRVAWGRHRG
ncbi:MAG TPA: hypothetical protein VNA04_03340 [Thermoanaerobaculia bacterium]|nr:hypothetical protein [Thermoanaerobaculia bacterium]